MSWGGIFKLEVAYSLQDTAKLIFHPPLLHSEPVGIHLFDTSQYQLLGVQGGIDYARLTPSDGYVVHISEGSGHQNPSPFTVTMLHQLKCLEIYRSEYAKEPAATPTKLLRHCMNYLRQTILCQSNLRLESVRSDKGQSAKQYDTVCRDWAKVYEEVKQNQVAYMTWTNKSSAN